MTSPKSFFKGFTFYELGIFGRAPTPEFKFLLGLATLYVYWFHFLLNLPQKCNQFTKSLIFKLFVYWFLTLWQFFGVPTL